MRVWLRWYEYDKFMQEWWGDDILAKKTPFCRDCPLQFDDETPDFRWAYGSSSVHLRQQCTCDENGIRASSYYVPLKFVELNEYLNFGAWYETG